MACVEERAQDPLASPKTGSRQACSHSHPSRTHPAAVAQNIKIALTDGAAHAVDSNEMAFKLACMYAFKGAFLRASPVVLEPIMNVEVPPLAAVSSLLRGAMHRHACMIMRSLP